MAEKAPVVIPKKKSTKKTTVSKPVVPEVPVKKTETIPPVPAKLVPPVPVVPPVKKSTEVKKEVKVPDKK